jgi:hypothetical protein
MTEQLDAGTNAPEENLSTEGTISEDVDTTDVETTEPTDSLDDVESEEQIDQEALRKKRNAEKAKKMLSEKNEMKVRIEQLERTNALKDLQLKYGIVDEASIIQLKEQHSSLSYEDCLLLHNSKVNKEIEPAKEDL